MVDRAAPSSSRLMNLFDDNDDAARPVGVGFLEELENAGARPAVATSRPARVRPWFVTAAVATAVLLAAALYLSPISNRSPNPNPMAGRSPTYRSTTRSTTIVARSTTPAPQTQSTHPTADAASSVQGPPPGTQLGNWVLLLTQPARQKTATSPFDDGPLATASLDTLGKRHARAALAPAMAGEWSLHSRLATTRNVRPSALAAIRPQPATPQQAKRHAPPPKTSRDAQLLETLMRQLGHQ